MSPRRGRYDDDHDCEEAMGSRMHGLPAANGGVSTTTVIFFT